jgi:hypothetical protein
MLWLLIGTAILAVLLLSLRAFERASVASITSLMKWLAVFGGLGLTGLLFLSGRGPQALGGLILVGPWLFRTWQQHNASIGSAARAGASGPGPGSAGGGTAGTPPPRRQGSTMTKAEAYEVLGLKPGANADEVQSAHRRLMRMAHPDTGGSDWLASRVNQARDALLR